MRLIDKCVFGADKVEKFLRIRRTVYGSVLRILVFEGLLRLSIHVPEYGLRESQGPVSAKVNIGLLRRNQQKVRAGLLAAGAIKRRQLPQARFAGIARGAVTMEIHDHGRVHAHRRQRGLERRNPVETFSHGWDSVGVVPWRRAGM